MRDAGANLDVPMSLWKKMRQAQKTTYGQLRRRLLGIGFTEKTVPGSHRVFEHAASGAIIVFGAHSDQEIARQADVISTRRQLSERGLIPMHNS